jgi:AmmeMemoRadiSam system protein B
MSSLIRHPAVAGKFYPQDRNALAHEVQSYLSASINPLPALGVIAPHAGYKYSGGVAGAVFAATEIPETCIVLCPNHTGMGTPLSIMSSGAWQTPLGTVEIDESVAGALKERFPLLTEDVAAHRNEHAIEVELPFLLTRNPRVKFVPIALGTSEFEVLGALGEAMATVLATWSERVLIVASSDMNHYENDAVTRVKDRKAIDRLLALDAAGLFAVVMREDISMCGFGPAVVMLTAAKRLGARSAELIRYATSGDVSGDREMVVGYAGVVVR